MGRHRIESLGVGLTFALGLMACAGAPAQRPSISSVPPASQSAIAMPLGARAVHVALSMLGTPYRYGGTTPDGFDCSGLVVYSYAQAGLTPLPRTAAGLAAVAKPVRFDALEPGDLLFFQLTGRKTSHVAMYVGNRSFVHAPSPGKQVERVNFDHGYWAPRLTRAGRIIH